MFRKIGKITVLFLVAGFTFSVGDNASAAVTSNESSTINWDEVWESVDYNNNISDTINFGSGSTNSEGVSLQAWGDLASGSTKLSSGSGKITSTGKSKGKILTTVTSATTSLRISGMGYITGPKKIAIGKLTATSEVSTSNPSGSQSFEGLTIHTATNSGVLYEARTHASGSY